MPQWDYHGWGVVRQKTRTTARLRWWLAQQLLTIDCQDVGGSSEQTAIPLAQGASALERYDGMLRYARCAFGRDWRLDHIEQLRRKDQLLECLVVTMPDERQRRLWFDLTAERH